MPLLILVLLGVSPPQVIGHSNCVGSYTSQDVGFVYLDHGSIHLGNFGNGSKWDINKQGGPPLNVESAGNLNLNVEGEGWVKQLKHGFPHTRKGLRAMVEAVDEEPAVLRASNLGMLRLHGLGHNQSTATAANGSSGPRLLAGAYYEVTVAGAGIDNERGQPVEYTGRFLLTPLLVQGRATLLVSTLVRSGGLHRVEALDCGSVVEIEIEKAAEQHMVVDVRRVGLALRSPDLLL